MPSAEPLVHALSFDVEDWFHIVEVAAVDDPALWPALSARSSLVERYTDRILAICAEHRVRATFFVLGWIAERHPALVKRIAEAGHEIATHSFWHRRVDSMSPDELRDDVAQSLQAIRSAAGDIRVRGFRAPSFSIVPGTEWAFDVLAGLGIEYDASLFPATRAHGGYPGAEGPHAVATPSGRAMPELPMSVARIGVGPLRRSTCYSGGGYLRLLPSFLIEQGIAAEERAGRSTVVYLHPRDIAPDCPRVPMPLHRRFKCYVGLGSAETKLRTLLKRHRFAACEELLASRGLLT